MFDTGKIKTVLLDAYSEGLQTTTSHAGDGNWLSGQVSKFAKLLDELLSMPQLPKEESKKDMEKDREKQTQKKGKMKVA